MQDLLIQIYDQLPADEKRLKWKFEEVTQIWSVTVLGLKVEMINPVASKVYVKLPFTTWLFVGDDLVNITHAKAEALRVAAKQLSMLSHTLTTYADNFEQI